MNTIKLTKTSDNYYTWTKDKQATIAMQRAYAKAFGVWWLRIKREQVEAGLAMMQDKHNTAFFSDLGDFLYVDTIQEQ